MNVHHGVETKCVSKLLKAAVKEILDEIDARHPGNLVDRAAFRRNVLDRYEVLLG